MQHKNEPSTRQNNKVYLWPWAVLHLLLLQSSSSSSSSSPPSSVANEISPGVSILRQSLQILNIYLQVTAPGVPRSASFSSALWAPGEMLDLVFQRAWPIHLKHLWRISTSTTGLGCWWCSGSFWGRCLMKVWMLFHVSGFTVVLKILNLMTSGSQV